MTGFADPRLTTRPRRPGAEDGARTRDLNLGKVALYQLSYFRAVRHCNPPGSPANLATGAAEPRLTPIGVLENVDFEPFD